MEPGPIAAAVAFVLGYAIGTVPVAWLLVRREAGVDMRVRGLGGTGALNTIAVAGPRAALLAAALEVAKGAAAGLGARLYSPSGWFIATAIAGCVAGDAFPIALRRHGRGLIPLVSGLLVALPAAGVITALAAIPAAALTPMRGRVYDGVVAIAVPAGLYAGTRQWLSLAPAAVIVAVLLARAQLRRRRRDTALLAGRAGRVVIDADPPPGSGVPREGSAGQNPRPWVS